LYLHLDDFITSITAETEIEEKKVIKCSKFAHEFVFWYWTKNCFNQSDDATNKRAM